MDPVGDSAGAGEVSTPVGAVRGMARLGVGDIIARDIGAVIMVGIMDITTTIITIHTITDRQDAQCPAVILREEVLPADTMPALAVTDIHQTEIRLLVLLL